MRYRLCLALGVLVAALSFTAGAFADGVDYYFTGTWWSGDTRATAYDTCSYPGWIYDDYWQKGSSDYGTVMFIDNTGYNWHRTSSGYGSLYITEPSYTSYTKKAASYNSSSVGFYANASAYWITHICT